MAIGDFLLWLSAVLGALAVVWGTMRKGHAWWKRWIAPMLEFAKAIQGRPDAGKMLHEIWESQNRLVTELTVNGGTGTVRDLVEATRTDVQRMDLRQQLLREDVHRIERRQRLLHQDAAFGWFETDADGGLADANRTLLRWLERSVDEIRGRAWLMCTHAQDRDRVRTEWDAALAEGREFVQEFRIVALSGKVLGVHVTASPTGEARCYVGKVMLDADANESRRDTRASER